MEPGRKSLRVHLGQRNLNGTGKRGEDATIKVPVLHV